MEKCAGPKCDRDHWSKGLCLAHYKQQWKGRELTPLYRHLATMGEKLRAKSEIDPVTGCWNWQGPLCEGYGRITREGRIIGTHVASVLDIRGEEIPDGHEVCHRCHNRACCNPDHLYVGTRKANVADTVAAGRASNRLTRQKVCEIRASGEAFTTLAERYGVEVQTIRKIVNRRTWRDVA